MKTEVAEDLENWLNGGFTDDGYSKHYVAEIRGEDEKYGMKRKFISKRFGMMRDAKYYVKMKYLQERLSDGYLLLEVKAEPSIKKYYLLKQVKPLDCDLLYEINFEEEKKRSKEIATELFDKLKKMGYYDDLKRKWVADVLRDN